MEREAIIYALCEPETIEIRYIGKAFSPRLRYFSHMGECLQPDTRNPRHKWVVNLLGRGQRPVMRTLEVTDESNVREAELKWIRHGLAMGWRLLNVHYNPGVRKAYEPKLPYRKAADEPILFDLDAEGLERVEELASLLNMPLNALIIMVIGHAWTQEIQPRHLLVNQEWGDTDNVLQRL